MIAETALAAIFFLWGREVVGVVVFVWIISLKLILSDDSLAPFLPFLLIGLLVLRLYDSYDEFMALKFVLGAPAVTGVLFHFLVYRKKPRAGRLTRGYLALSAALLLGGLFSLPAADYFSGTSLYYVLGLGLGMLLLYSLLLFGVNPREEYDTREYVAKTALYCGVFLLFMIAVQYLSDLSSIRDGWLFSQRKLSSMSNNLSTSALLTMPFLFYLSRKGGFRGGACFAVGVLEAFAAVLSLSRGGIIFASAMGGFLSLFTIVKDRAGRRRDLAILAGILLLALGLYLLFRQEFDALFQTGIVPTEKKLRILYAVAAILAASVTAYAYYLFRLRDPGKRRVHLVILSCAAVVGAALFLLFFDRFRDLLVRADGYRGKMMIIAAENFPKYPLFGTGIGYQGLRGVYPHKKGMFGCYHCLPVQVVGSMGLFGAVAYLYMFHERLAALDRSSDREFSAVVLFSYLGILWMSLVNPGIFCPLVYGVQTAVYFIAAERAPDSPKNPEK